MGRFPPRARLPGSRLSGVELAHPSVPVTKGDPEVNDATKTSLSRRRLLKVAGTAAAGAAALGQFPRPAHAHDLTPSDPLYHFAQYEAVANRAVTFRQLYAWPNINNSLIFANASNGLNSFVFSYGVPEGDIQVIVQAYASANLAMYNDMLWQKYSLGQAYAITDPATKQPAVRNIWYHSPNPAPDTRSSDRTNPYYSDTSMEGLQRRGVLFLT